MLLVATVVGRERALVQRGQTKEEKSESEPQTSANGAGQRGNGRGNSVHGNSRTTKNLAIGYSLRDKTTGKILKYGETTIGGARYTKTYLDNHNARMQKEATGSKRDMYKWQHKKILEYKAQHGGAGLHSIGPITKVRKNRDAEVLVVLRNRCRY